MTKPAIAAALILSLSVVSLAEKKKTNPTPVFADVTARGRALYEYDEAAWHASDAVQALHPPPASVGRYIAHKSESGWVVAFGHLNDKRDAFLIAYEAIQGASPEQFTTKEFDPPQEDRGFYLQAAVP